MLMLEVVQATGFLSQLPFQLLGTVLLLLVLTQRLQELLQMGTVFLAFLLPQGEVFFQLGIIQPEALGQRHVGAEIRFICQGLQVFQELTGLAFQLGEFLFLFFHQLEKIQLPATLPGKAFFPMLFFFRFFGQLAFRFFLLFSGLVGFVFLQVTLLLLEGGLLHGQFLLPLLGGVCCCFSFLQLGALFFFLCFQAVECLPALCLSQGALSQYGSIVAGIGLADVLEGSLLPLQLLDGQTGLFHIFQRFCQGA